MRVIRNRHADPVLITTAIPLHRLVARAFVAFGRLVSPYAIHFAQMLLAAVAVGVFLAIVIAAAG